VTIAALRDVFALRRASFGGVITLRGAVGSDSAPPWVRARHDRAAAVAAQPSAGSAAAIGLRRT
jgi:hypothetical protein